MHILTHIEDIFRSTYINAYTCTYIIEKVRMHAQIVLLS